MYKVLNLRILSNFFYIFGVTVVCFILISNANGVPQGVTGSPAEVASNSCGTCHEPAGSFSPSIQLNVLDQSLSPVTQYVPGNTYTISVKVSANGNPKAYGFQLSCLDSLTQTDQGVWSNLGANVRQLNLNILQKQRKYLVQSSPKADGTFSAQWKAPDVDKGKIKFYFAGLATNLDGSTSGDNHIIGQLTLPSNKITANEDINASKNTQIYPNPATDWLSVTADDLFALSITDVTGRQINQYQTENNHLNINYLQPGIYFISLLNTKGSIIGKHTLLKR
jgi:hypothetical protein